MPRRAAPLTDFDKIEVSAIELATMFGISDKELTSLARRGHVPRLPNPKYSREWLYPLGSAVTAYTQYQRREQTQAQREYLVARTRAQTATAAKKELEIAVRNGTLIEKQKVIRALEPLVVLMRNAVLTRADRLERAITSSRTRKAKLEVIRKSDLEVLQMFADLVKPLENKQNGESAAKATL